jgi:hypothetical protein
MATAHLAFKLVGNLVSGELVSLFRDHQLEGEVQQEIADLAPDVLRLPFAECVVQLQHLLDQVGPQGLPGLGTVPRTPAAEVTHHRESASKR